MVFIVLVIFAIGLYIWDYKISALLIFFFFLTSGFNLIPEKIMEIKLFSKGMDYAILIIAGIVIIDSFCIKNYLKPDKLLWFIFTFYGFLVICIIYNKYVVGVGWKDIVRTARYNVLWIAYLVFRNLPKERLLLLLKCLFLVTVGCSILFLLQMVLDEFILNKGMKIYFNGFGMKIPRFYNQPDMLQFFTFMAIYFNPYKGMSRIVTTIILIAALLGAFHRSLFIAFAVAISIGYIIFLPYKKKIVVITSISILSLFIIIFWGYRFASSRTIKDIAIVTSGNVADIYSSDIIDIEDLQKSTFTFRIAHLLERNQYLLDHPQAMLFGAGLMAEDSKLTNTMFNFNVGLTEESLDKTVQLDTGDISYSPLILRYGYAGTLLILSLYVFLMYYFYKNRDNPVGLFSFVYFIVVIVGTFFSYILTLPVTFLLPLIAYSIVQKNKNEYE
jgi:hypothetical protein